MNSMANHVAVYTDECLRVLGLICAERRGGRRCIRVSRKIQYYASPVVLEREGSIFGESLGYIRLGQIRISVVSDTSRETSRVCLKGICFRILLYSLVCSNQRSQCTISRSPELYHSLPGAIGPLGTIVKDIHEAYRTDGDVSTESSFSAREIMPSYVVAAVY